MPRRDSIDHVKIVNPKRGGVYYYFDTGKTKPGGRKIFKRLPDIDDRTFWTTYAAYCAGRTKRTDAASALMLSELIALYRKGKKFTTLRPSSQKLYDIYLNELERAFNTAQAGQVERIDMVGLIDSRADKPGAANMILRVSSALYSWARSRGHVTNNPCADIDLFELGEHEPWPEDLLLLGLAAEEDIVRWGVHLLYFTGQRIGDCVNMGWSDYKDRRVSIIQEKTGKAISITPHPSLAALLDATTPSTIKILSLNGRPITREKLRDVLQAWASKLGYDIVPHGLRKNAVNALLEAGCSTAETSAITGQSLQVVEHYAKGRDNRRLADSAVLKWSANII